MSDTLANLVKMANQIGSFFETMQDHDKALADVAKHLKNFWAPTMRRALLDHVEQEGGSDLRPIVLEAVKRHWDTLAPAKPVNS
jgi:formate dehydrogenase subunit delta